MENNEINKKFRNVLRNAIRTDNMTEAEIEEIIDEAYAKLNLTPELIAEQARQGEANGIDINQQMNIANLLVMKVKHGI